MVENKSDIDLAMLASLLNKKLDPQMKFKVLDMVDKRPLTKIDELDPVKHKFDQEQLAQFLQEDHFQQSDFLLWDDFTFFENQADGAACREEALSIAEQGHLKEAGFGRKDGH